VEASTPEERVGIDDPRPPVTEAEHRNVRRDRTTIS
jgi:hypothetical protein